MVDGHRDRTHESRHEEKAPGQYFYLVIRESRIYQFLAHLVLSRPMQ